MTAARAISVVTALLVMMALTRILDPMDYGAYKKLWLVFMLFSPGITSMLVKTLYYRGEVSDFNRALWTAVTLALLLSGSITLVVLIGGPVLSSLLQAPEIQQALQWFALYILFATYSSLAEPVFVMAGRKKWLLAYNLTYNIIEAGLIVIPFYAGLPLETVVQIMTLGPFLRSLFLTFFAYQQGGAPVFSKIRKEIPSSLSYGFGVLLIFITGIGITQIDKLIVATFFESEELYAIYVVGAQTLPLVPAFISSVTSAFVVQYAGQLASNDYQPVLQAIRSATNRLFLIITPIIVTCFFLAEPIMVVLFDQYAESAPVFQIYALSTLYKLFLAETLLLATGKTRVIAVFNAGEVLVNIPLSLMLIPFLGILGPALATLVAHLAAVLALSMYTAKTEQISLTALMPSGRIRPLLISLPVLGFISYLLIQSGLPNLVVVAVGGALCAGVIAFHNRKFVTK